MTKEKELEKERRELMKMIADIMKEFGIKNGIRNQYNSSMWYHINRLIGFNEIQEKERCLKIIENKEIIGEKVGSGMGNELQRECFRSGYRNGRILFKEELKEEIKYGEKI